MKLRPSTVLAAPKRLWKELENEHGPVAAPESRPGSDAPRTLDLEAQPVDPWEPGRI